MTNILANKAMLANLTISCWGGRRFDKQVTNGVLIENNAAHDAGLFTKRLLNKAAMKKINAAVTEARAQHWRLTQPWSDDGIRILPTALYLDYTKNMQTLKNDFDASVSEFIREYPKYRDEAVSELGKLFKAEDYPSADTLQWRFSFSVSFMPCPDSGDFRVDIDEDEMKEIKRDLEQHMKAQYESAVRNTAERIAQTVGHMAERLKAYKPKDGKKKVENMFRNATIEHVRDLCDLIPAFNLGNDPKLTKIHSDIKKRLCKFDAEDLRESDVLRDKVAADAERIVQAVSEFLA